MAVERLPKLNFSIPFAMTSALPLDANSYFESLEAAMTAAESAEQAGSSATQYYFGQNIIVVEDNKATLYIIQPDKTLKPVGSGAAADVEVDGKSITSSAGILALKGFSSALTNQQVRVGENGELEWFTPDNSAVEDLQTDLDSKVDKVEGKGLSTNDFTNELKTKLDGIQAGAQTNVLESVKLNGQALPISEKAVDIPVASSTVLGIVKGTDAENGVVVNGDGTMVINKLNVNQLVQTEGDELILNGGNSN